jgi:S-formylglutathione hydrolase FrmB
LRGEFAGKRRAGSLEGFTQLDMFKKIAQLLGKSAGVCEKNAGEPLVTIGRMCRTDSPCISSALYAMLIREVLIAIADRPETGGYTRTQAEGYAVRLRIKSHRGTIMILQGDIYSEALHMHTNLSVFMPDKLEGRDAYKTVYLLHGLHGNNSTWLHNTTLSVFARETNTAFIMPEVGRSFFTDMRYGCNYFTYMSEELPRICKRFFNISDKLEDTAVMGCSMGGFGALKLALTRPDRYGFCGAISPAGLFIDEMLDAIRKDPSVVKKESLEIQVIVKDLYSIFGDDLAYKEGDVPLQLARKAAASPIIPQLYVTCGTEDGLVKENRRFADEVREFLPAYAYEEWQGAHEWDFFNDALKKSLDMWNKCC